MEVEMAQERTQVVPVQMADGRTIHVEARVLEPVPEGEARSSGEQDVLFRRKTEEERGGLAALPFEHVTSAITDIAQAMTGALEKAKPRRSQVEFGLEIAVEAGQLTALIVKGGGTASLTVTLEWGSS
jgi:hypothetical protein